MTSSVQAEAPPRRSALGGWLRFLVMAAVCAVLGCLGWNDVAKLLHWQPMGIDFLPMWAASHEAFIHPERVYDFNRLTHFQAPEMEQFRGLRPFVYPPTLLLATMARQAPRMLVLAAMLLTPASILVVVTGQLTFAIASLAVMGIVCLKDRPQLAGLLFGIAGVLKPQAMVVLPVALIAIGAWRALVATALTAGLAALASLLVLGPQFWFAWLGALARFDEWVMANPALLRGMITPTAFAIRVLKFDAGDLALWRLGWAIGAGVMAWFVFRGTQDTARRLAALLGGGLLISPYAMHYDAALLAPAAALMLTHRLAPLAWIWALIGGALLSCAAIPNWGALAVPAFILVAALTPENALAGRRAAAPAPTLQSKPVA